MNTTRAQLVRKGQHSCTWNSRIIQAGNYTGMKGTFILHLGAWYDRKEWGDHLNKLTGFATNLFGENRLRIAWRPAATPGRHEIYAYMTLNGKYMRGLRLVDDLLGNIKEGEKCYFEINHYVRAETETEELSGRMADFTLDGYVCTKPYPTIPGLGMVQNLYFGGASTAPQDIRTTLTYSLT